MPHERAILLVKCDFSYSCAVADKISTDLRARAVSVAAELLVLIMGPTACGVGSVDVRTPSSHTFQTYSAGGVIRFEFVIVHMAANCAPGAITTFQASKVAVIVAP